MIKGGMGNLMKQAQKMQQQMQETQAALAQQETIGESGAGLVKIVMTGRHDVKKVSIDDSLMSEDKDMLEDLLAAAINNAVQKIEKAQQDQMSDMTGNMGLPDGFKLPF